MLRRFLLFSNSIGNSNYNSRSKRFICLVKHQHSWVYTIKLNVDDDIDAFVIANMDLMVVFMFYIYLVMPFGSIRLFLTTRIQY